jgi:glycosyltransferase involved in cell wall biosynthesis
LFIAAAIQLTHRQRRARIFTATIERSAADAMSRRRAARKYVMRQRRRAFAQIRPQLLHQRGDRIAHTERRLGRRDSTPLVEPAHGLTNLLTRPMAAPSIRILQLLDVDGGFQARRGAEALARDLGAGFEVRLRTIGCGGDYATLFAAVAGLRRDASLDERDLVHAWGGRALTAAAMARRGRIVHSPQDGPLSRRGVRWVRSVMQYRDVNVVCATATVRRACVERGGIPLERCHLIRPGVEFARVRRRRDPVLRHALGLTESDRVMLLAGESTRAAGHRQAVWAAAILGVLDAKYRVLAWGRGPDVPALEHLARSQNQPKLFTSAEGRLGRSVEFEDLLPAADLVLATPTGAVATLPVSIAMAAGLPIVATVSYTIGELLEDRHTALLVAPGSAKALARRVLELEEDAGLQWSISDMARTEAYEYFSLTRFVEQYRQVYRQIAAGAKVEVSETAPGAGMRFHGRG